MKASTFYMLQILYKRLMQKSGEQSEHWRADSDRVTYMALQTDHSRRLPAALRPRPSLGLLKSLKPSQRAPPKHQASKITRMVGLQSVTYFRKRIWVMQLCNRNITLKKKKKISTQSLWTFGLFPLWNLCYEPLDWLCPLCPVSCLQQPCSAPADPLWLLLWDQSSSLAFFFSGCLLFFPALLSFPKNTTFSQMESRMTASWGRWGMLGGWGNWAKRKKNSWTWTWTTVW